MNSTSPVNEQCESGLTVTALVGEFLPLEVAAIKAISVTAATWRSVTC